MRPINIILGVIRLFVFFLIILSVSSSYSFADSNYSKQVEQFSEQVVFNKYQELFELIGEQKLNIKAMPIAKNIMLEKCPKPLRGSIISNKIKQHTSVKVSCPDTKRWDIYIRVAVNPTIPLGIGPSLSKKEPINIGDPEFIYKDASKLNNNDKSHNPKLFNKTTAAKHNYYVCQNDNVTITANKNGIAIKIPGVALNNGKIGSKIEVLNVKTQEILIGTVYILKEVQIYF
ncbi:flagella basal body P-ring formation protein FlgA [Psychromonas sp. RZ22]|uniref:flagella basal body P-ring formation protein FlgA n=1 Tax=Psychromonas algarum TaxID=2555643 RepID=UPI0010671D91|nr:flagella basal body P-ring formation protein FlgA [Psychromonas sp. RZ22]TEW53433.1 flagella basal body P-ring formation protein FlgA [Psychromonas sp. RZ22]